MKELINLTQYADALRSTGYKNIESAISEIIDNSIEAGAKEILLILKEKIDGKTGTKKINEIAFLDNGTGMDRETLESSLRIGCGTRVARKGMGRFGVGLPQASMHACPMVDVYSWQDYGNPYKAYLNINKIKSGEQTGIDTPISELIPLEYRHFLKYETENDDEPISFVKNGTFVLWKECDNVRPTKAATLMNKLQFTLGQKFRYFINSNQCKIILVNIDNSGKPVIIKPNDPLMLMEDNIVLGDRLNPYEKAKDESHKEPVFEPFCDKDNFLKNGIGKIKVNYRDFATHEINSSYITLKCSIVKEEFYGLNFIPPLKNPGNGYIGQHLKKVEGISIVRANREIDFGRFDFYSAVNEPVHRWWGIEIEFGTELDEVFGVANNKQHVELIQLSEEEFSEEDIKPVWIELSKIITELIKQMKKRNKDLRTKKANHTEESEENQGREERISENIINISSLNEVDCVTKNIQQEDSGLASKAAESLSKENSKCEIEDILQSKINIIYEKMCDDGQAFNFDVEKGVAICRINTNHEFYKSFLKECSNEVATKTCIELLFGGFLRVVDTTKDYGKRNLLYSVVKEWNIKLTKYMNTLKSM